MRIARESANHFISHYSLLMHAVWVCSSRSGPEEMETSVLQVLMQGRRAWCEQPELLGVAQQYLSEQGQVVAEDVLAALSTMQVRQWVHLRDTSRYSIFIDAEHERAYPVLGLTDALAQIAPPPSTMQTAVLLYRGQYICDGLLEAPMLLGPGLTREFNEIYREIKAEGGWVPFKVKAVKNKSDSD